MEWLLPSTKLTTGRFSQKKMSLMNDMITTDDANDSRKITQWPYFVVTDYNGRLVTSSLMFLPLLVNVLC
jgi:hypothetical protein